VDYVAPTELVDAIETLVDAAELACSDAGQTSPGKASDKRFLGVPLDEVKAAARQAGEAAIERQLAAGLSVSGLDATSRIVHYTREQAEQIGAYQDDAAPLADAVQAQIQLVEVESLAWQGVDVPVWLPVDSNGKALCGAILYVEDMPPSLRVIFMVWLAQQVLSISRPPLGLPRQGQAHFLEDVLTAVEASA